MMTKIGILGGSFDPVHNGHICMAQATLKQGFEKLIVVPCLLSPHKTASLGEKSPQQATHRWNMLQLALASTDPRLELSAFELEGPSPSYTYRTIEYMKQKFPEASLFLVMGQDSWRALPTWARFDQWRSTVQYLVFERPGLHQDCAAAFDTSDLCVTYAHEPIPPISSSIVRQAIVQGKPLDELVPWSVAQYIQAHELYKNA